MKIADIVEKHECAGLKKLVSEVSFVRVEIETVRGKTQLRVEESVYPPIWGALLSIKFCPWCGVSFSLPSEAREAEESY